MKGLRLVGGTEKRESMIQYLCTHGISPHGVDVSRKLADKIITFLDASFDNFAKFAMLTNYLSEHLAQEFLRRFNYLPLERKRRAR